MIAPERRIMLFPVGHAEIEILILGEPVDIAGLVAVVSTQLSSWIGLSHVKPIMMGSQVVGFRAFRDENATHHDPIAEAMLMLRQVPIEWADGGPRAMVGTW